MAEQPPRDPAQDLSNHPGKPRELPRYVPYQPVLPGVGAANPAAAASPAANPPAPVARLQRDAAELSGQRGPGADLDGELNFEAMAEEVAGPKATQAIQTAAALGELGVVATLGAVATAYARTTFDPEAVSASLSAFATHLQNVGEQVMAVPGVGDALMAFGGVGAIASGVGMLNDALQAQDQGRGVFAAATAAAGAAKLVGGVATALSPFFPPLAAVGGLLTLSGVGLQLGAMAVGAATAPEGEPSGGAASEPTMGPNFLAKAFAGAQSFFRQSSAAAAQLMGPPNGGLVLATVSVGAGPGGPAPSGPRGGGAEEGLARLIGNHGAAMVGPGGGGAFSWLGLR